MDVRCSDVPKICNLAAGGTYANSESFLRRVNGGDEVLFNKLTSFIRASVLLLVMNFNLTLSKYLKTLEAIAVDPYTTLTMS